MVKGMQRTNVHRRLVMAAATLGLAGLGAPAAQADARVVPCSKHRHELSRAGGSVVWKQSGSVYGCVSGYAESDDPYYDAPSSKARRLGPWSKGSRLVFDGVEVAWAYRTRSKAGESVDRIYVADARTGAWLRGARPTFDLADRVVADLRLGTNLAAWVTERGTVMAAAEGGFGDVDDPDPFDLEFVGTGTPGASGLVDALAPQGKRLLIGRFQEHAAQAGATLRLEPETLDEQETCIGSIRWWVTVRPLATEPRVGGVWRAGYFPSGPECSR